MSDLEKDIKEIKDLLREISKTLGVGTVPPASQISLERQAAEMAKRLNSGHKKRDGKE